ncbi:MAG: ComEA family DNA-binding protein [Actinobacteria bacterium]|nr:ComEA family DNA-binding protein [Actinomycetota bacterium]
MARQNRMSDLHGVVRDVVEAHRRAVAALLVGALGAGAVAVVVVRSAPEPATPLPRVVRVTTTTAPPPPIVVHVSGAVVQPGLVEVPAGARVADAVRAAGGVRPPVDLAGVNLAQVVVDGVRVHIPAPGEPAQPVAAPGQLGGDAAGGLPLDLNRATATELERLPGVGPSTAAAIITHRTRVGRFGSVEELLDVPGIGPAKLATIRPSVRV